MSTIQVTYPRPDIAQVTLDQEGSAANILSDSLFNELDECFRQLKNRSDLNGLILASAKPKIFVAGADLNEITAALHWPDSRIVQFCERGRNVMRHLSDAPFPSVAAIHGACVGGGLEITLFCDSRIATDDRRTVLGLPEVKLGLVPGWAGTVRLPRLTGLTHAIDLVTSARLVRAAEAHEMGFVDSVVAHDQLIESSIAAIEELNQTGTYLTAREHFAAAKSPSNATEDEIAALRSKFEKRIHENNSIFEHAPKIVLKHMLETANLPLAAAESSESHAMATVWGSPSSQGLLNNFFLGEHNRKRPGHVDTSLEANSFQNIGVIGAGVMGRSIAANNLKRGKSICILDASHGVAQEAAESLAETGGESASIVAAQKYEQLAQTQLAIESVVENLGVKKTVLEKIDAAVQTDAIIASNTSSIPIAQMAGFVSNPSRFCGIHFCHPELMSLVEVVRGPETSEQTMANAVGYVRSLGKMPIAVNDGAGFIVNRLLSAMLDQAIRLFTQGHSIESIDAAMRKFGFRAGPFEIIDVIGADTCFFAGQVMYSAGLQCVSSSPPILPKMIKANRLGRKTGIGFYKYERPDSDPEWDAELTTLIEPYRDGVLHANSNPDESTDDIAMQVLSVVTLEAMRILDDNIAADPRDIDLCIINGFSFPPEQGGILFWASNVGLNKIVKTLTAIAKQERRLAPTEKLLAMAENDERFY